MIKKAKKAFTIVELVIVIAVVAILMAVLIPTFVSLVKKANVSSDTQLVRNLNTALRIDGTEHKTMQSALDAAEESGFDVAKISSKVSENEILWDSKNDVFCYLNNGAIEYVPDSVDAGKKLSVGSYQLWKIVDEVPAIAEQKYSLYLSGDAYTEAVEVSVGFDAGKNSSIPSVTYSNTGTAKKEVVLRTNSYNTEVIVNAPADTVAHYDKAKLVNIIEVASASYHEHGDVQGNITLNKGRVVTESGAKASAIVISATADQIRNDAVIVKADNTAAPQIPVVIPEETKTAIEEVIGSDAIKASAESIVTDSSTIENMSKFAGGLGTETSPYLIATEEQWKKIDENTNRASFALLNDLNLVEGYCVYRFYGTFDGRGYTLTTYATESGCPVFGYLYGTVKNVVLNQAGDWIAPLAYYCDDGSQLINIKAVANDGNIKWCGYGESNFTAVAWGNTVLFKDCENAVNYNVMYNYAGIFVGNMVYSTYTRELTFENCKNTGVVFGESISFFIGNDSRYDSSKTNIKVLGCQNTGVIYGSIAAAPFCVYTTSSRTTFDSLNAEVLADSAKFIKGAINEESDKITSYSKDAEGNLAIDVSSRAANTVRVIQFVSVSLKKENGTSAGSWYFPIMQEFDTSTDKNVKSKLYTTFELVEDTSSFNESEKLQNVYGLDFWEVKLDDGTYKAMISLSSLLAAYGNEAVSASLGNTVVSSIYAFDINTVHIAGARFLLSELNNIE